MADIVHHILTMLCRIKCIAALHSKRIYHYCNKCGPICIKCKRNSIYLAFAYLCHKCNKSFCLHHYQMPIHCNIIYYTTHPRHIVFFNKTTQLKTTIVLSADLPQSTDSISYGGRIFIIGGYTSGVSDVVYEVNILTKKFIKKSPMLCKKYAHSLCISNNEIYSIGGFQQTNIDDCQKYNVAKNKWTQLPHLNFTRDFSAAFSFNNKKVYSLGGHSTAGILNSMESVCVSAPVSWENEVISNAFASRYGLHAIQISNSEVLVFGGGIESYKMKINNSIMIKECANMVSSDLFYESVAPVYDGKNVYGVDSGGNIHIYSIKKDSWSIITKMK